MKLTFESKAEQLNYEIGILMGGSRDPQFSQYLGSITFELKSAPEDAENIRKKVIANYDIYAERMRSQGIEVEPLYFKAIYGNMDAPEVKGETPAAAPAPALSEPVQTAQEPAPASEPQPFTAPEPQSFTAPGPQPYVQPYPQTAPATNPSFASKSEYSVGAIIMSVLGSVLLLTGLVYFAVNFLDTFAQGMILYLVCGIVLLVSELVVRRLVPKLSSVFTAIGISGVFLSTVVNYRGLDNIGFGVAAVIVAICSVLVCLFGYVRKSQLYSIIGFLAAFISSVCIGNNISPAEYMIITLGTLLISVLWLIFPVKQNQSLAGLIMIVAEFIYMFFTMGFYVDSSDTIDKYLVKCVFVAVSWIVVTLIFYISEKNTGVGGSPSPLFELRTVALSVASYFYGISLTIEFNLLEKSLDEGEIILGGVLFYTAFVVPQIIILVDLMRRKSRAAFAVFLSLFLTGLTVITLTDCVYIIVPVYILYALVARMAARKFDSVGLKVIDLLVQIVVAIALLTCNTYDYNSDFEKYFAGIFLSLGAIAAIFVGRGFATAVQCIYTFAVCFCLSAVILPDDLGEAASMGVVLLLTFLINYFDSIKGNHYKVYNWFALVFDMILLLFCSNIDFSAEGVFIFCIAGIFGLALVILMLNKEYGMVFSGKFIMIPAYLTFISLIMRIEAKFVLSIILMAIALLSVVIGFVMKEKSIRIYGLVLSILMCGKIAIVDFVSIGDARAKTIMYILVGAFALCIGCIYLVLEVRENKKNAVDQELQ